MAKLWITEFDALPQKPLGKLPPVAEQVLTFTTTTQSTALNVNTNFVRVVSDADCHVAAGTNPTATTGSMKLLTGVAEYFAVTAGHKIAAVTA